MEKEEEEAHDSIARIQANDMLDNTSSDPLSEDDDGSGSVYEEVMMIVTTLTRIHMRMWILMMINTRIQIMMRIQMIKKMLIVMKMQTML